MAINRDEAKGAASDAEDADPELSAALNAANQFQVEILKENNRHKEVLAQKGMGIFGYWFGDKENAPVSIAATAILLGFVFAGSCLALAAQQPDARAFWLEWSKGSLAISATALGFIFGRRS